MSHLLELLASLIPSAYAAKIDQLGTSAPGVASMWAQIKAVLPFTTVGSAAPMFFAVRIMRFVASLISACAVLMIIYAAFKMIYGGEEGYSDGKKILQYAIGGLIAGIISSAAINYVYNTVIPQLLS